MCKFNRLCREKENFGVNCGIYQCKSTYRIIYNYKLNSYFLGPKLCHVDSFFEMFYITTFSIRNPVKRFRSNIILGIMNVKQYICSKMIIM